MRKASNELIEWLERSEETAKKKIASVALNDASENAPQWTGFLKDQGYAYVDGVLYDQTPGESTGERRIAATPEGGYNSDVAIAFKDLRLGRGGETFDYALYVGEVNPGWLRFAHTMHWIETALDPEINPGIFRILGASMAYNWK